MLAIKVDFDLDSAWQSYPGVRLMTAAKSLQEVSACMWYGYLRSKGTHMQQKDFLLAQVRDDIARACNHVLKSAKSTKKPVSAEKELALERVELSIFRSQIHARHDI